MPSCLGIYIDNNIIKYAKVTKDNNMVKIEASGVKFHDNPEETIKSIVNETFSYKTPVSINVSDEQYFYADLFSLLNKSDLEKAVQSEFEYYCNENAKNKNALQYKRLFIDNPEDTDKLKVLYAYIDRASLASKMQAVDGLKLSSAVPLPLCTGNLIKLTNQKNSMIVNIERTTHISTIVNGQIFKVDTISKGMKDVLDEITAQENSYEKSYEICKNSTIYTKAGKSLQTEENDYLESIMPTLYTIIRDIKDVMAKNGVAIENIYITGLGAVINNIDLYFQENFENQKCEILTPYFAEKTNIKVNIKDYIEVNSATALALYGLGEGPRDMSFVAKKGLDKLGDKLGGSGKENKGGAKEKGGSAGFFDLSSALDTVEKNMIRLVVALLILLVLYSIFTKYILTQMSNKQAEAQELIDDTQTKIESVVMDTRQVQARTSEYESLITKIDQSSNEQTQSIIRRNAIPNLLNRVMYAIPKEVQLTSVKNTSGKSVEIQAQSDRYQYLGFFLAKLKNDAILLNVTSSEGNKVGGVIQITITGDLPY